MRHESNLMTTAQRSLDASSALGLVPWPANVELADGEFTLTDTTVIVAHPEARDVADLLAVRLRPATGFPLPIVQEQTHARAIVIDIAPDARAAGPSAEGYALQVTPTAVRVTAPTAAGAFYGTQTLMQLFPPLIEASSRVLGPWVAPAVTISDAPRFSHRSVQVDVARSFLTPAEVKKIIDTMAMFKQNRLHLHLTDDQGWRIQITNDGKQPNDPVDYTRLTDISGKSAMLIDENGSWKQELGRHGYYTQSEYRDLVAYAAARHIVVIPEIDVPGHTNALLHAIPELNSEKSLPRPTRYGTAAEQNDGNVGRSALDVDNPQTWASLRHILSQLADMTSGEYLHTGGDEVKEMASADFERFIKKATNLVHDLGFKAMGWNEVAVAELNSGDIVHYWTGDKSATVDAARTKDVGVVVSQADCTYLDMKYDESTPLGLTWAGTGDVDKYYDWDPAAIIEGLDEQHIIGVEAVTWTETIRGVSQAEFMIFPRAIAQAEVGWSPQHVRNVDDFLRRMAAQGARLQARGTNFYDGPNVQWDTFVNGSPQQIGIDEERVDVALFAAPGTETTADQTAVKPAGGNTATGRALQEPITGTIDFGDGSEPVAAIFLTERPRDPVNATGLYRVGAAHHFSEPGRYDVQLQLSDGRRVASQVEVQAASARAESDGTSAVEMPTLEIEHSHVRDDSRLLVRARGFTPHSYVDVLWDEKPVGAVFTDARGAAEVSHYVAYETPEGGHVLRLHSSNGGAAEARVTVSSSASGASA